MNQNSFDQSGFTQISGGGSFHEKLIIPQSQSQTMDARSSSNVQSYNAQETCMTVFNTAQNSHPSRQKLRSDSNIVGADNIIVKRKRSFGGNGSKSGAPTTQQQFIAKQKQALFQKMGIRSTSPKSINNRIQQRSHSQSSSGQ